MSIILVMSWLLAERRSESQVLTSWEATRLGPWRGNPMVSSSPWLELATAFREEDQMSPGTGGPMDTSEAMKNHWGGLTGSPVVEWKTLRKQEQRNNPGLGQGQEAPPQPLLSI